MAREIRARSSKRSHHVGGGFRAGCGRGKGLPIGAGMRYAGHGSSYSGIEQTQQKMARQ